MKKLFLSLIAFAVSARFCFAQNRLPAPTSDTDIQTFIVHVLQAIVSLAIPVIAVAIVWAGFLYVAARGNEQKLKTAHRNLLFVLIGTALVLGAWALVTILGNTVSNIISA